jgi:hypothetical protein
LTTLCVLGCAYCISSSPKIPPSPAEVLFLTRLSRDIQLPATCYLLPTARASSHFRPKLRLAWGRRILNLDYTPSKPAFYSWLIDAIASGRPSKPPYDTGTATQRPAASNYPSRSLVPSHLKDLISLSDAVRYCGSQTISEHYLKRYSVVDARLLTETERILYYPASTISTSASPPASAHANTPTRNNTDPKAYPSSRLDHTEDLQHTNLR